MTATTTQLPAIISVQADLTIRHKAGGFQSQETVKNWLTTCLNCNVKNVEVTVSVQPSPSSIAEAKALFEKKFDDLRKDLAAGDLSQANFPLVGNEARIQLNERLTTLQWVLEMMP